MRLIILVLLISISSFASDWNFDFHLYSRGGITTSAKMDKKAASKDVFNLGAWGDESNTIRNNLTELTVEAKFKKNFKYVYGVDVDNNARFQGESSTPLNERLNYIEFLENKYSVWAGSRAYRGDGDYFTQSWPLDEHNLFGGGIRLEKILNLNIEFAYGIKKVTDPYTINIFINKLEYPLKNGKIKTNIEIHKVNDASDMYKSLTYMGGLQVQRWGDKLFGGDLYNIFVVNYSHGYVYGGAMQSVFNTEDKELLASKYLVKWGGDWKSKVYGFYYTLQYQHHGSFTKRIKWSFVDVYLRPVYIINSRFTTGVDYAQRYIIDNHVGTDWGADNYKLYENKRLALMLAYGLKDKNFGSPNIRAFVGRMIGEKSREYFSGEGSKRDETFVRLDYEVSF